MIAIGISRHASCCTFFTTPAFFGCSRRCDGVFASVDKFYNEIMRLFITILSDFGAMRCAISGKTFVFYRLKKFAKKRLANGLRVVV